MRVQDTQLKNTSRKRASRRRAGEGPPLALALALFFCLPGENICELFEWNLILEIA
jgi:hypothetical protein